MLVVKLKKFCGLHLPKLDMVFFNKTKVRTRAADIFGKKQAYVSDVTWYMACESHLYLILKIEYYICHHWPLATYYQICLLSIAYVRQMSWRGWYDIFSSRTSPTLSHGSPTQHLILYNLSPPLPSHTYHYTLVATSLSPHRSTCNHYTVRRRKTTAPFNFNNNKKALIQREAERGRRHETRAYIRCKVATRHQARAYLRRKVVTPFACGEVWH